MDSAAIIIFGLLVVGYVAMLALTERSAARYVRGETTTRSERNVFVVAGTPAKPVSERVPDSRPGHANPVPHRSVPDRAAA
jgi:hypothetical protein